MRYVEARLEQEVQECAYRIYVTDALRALVGANESYREWIKPQKIETRTSEDIINNIKDGLRKLGGESK